MASPRYIELHANSAFSFHRGASSPEELTRRAAELEIPAIAVTDRDGVYGSPRVHAKAREHGIRGIVGSELTMESGHVVPILVRSRTGYQNLCQMLSRAKLRAAKNESQIRWTELQEFAEGLTCLTGEALRGSLHADDRDGAERLVNQLIRTFGREHVNVEIQRHHVRGEERILRGAIDLADHLRLPIVATNGVRYSEPEQRRLLDVFTCLRNHVHLDTAGQMLEQNNERHLKSPGEMAELFRDLPQAIANTVRIAEQCEFTLTDLGYEFPEFPVEGDDTMAAKLHRETYAGANRRYDNKFPSKVKKQVEKELVIINRLGFAGYFLIVWDMINFCTDHDILVQGRGSAANSAVCFCLGITAVDPVEHELLFERFLSEGQGKWPDIDLDLPSGDRRESVIQEVYRRFAPNGAAMTANVITYRGRSAMREVGKALNLPEDIVSRINSMHPHGDFEGREDFVSKLGQAGLPKEHPRIHALAELYQMVYGLPRHLGQHSGGMVICTRGLNKVVPLEPAAMPNRVVVQWDKDDCEDLGIIKIDFLGLGMMSAIQDCRDLCNARGPSRAFDLARIPKDDAATYEMMQKADTVGVFQIESRAQMATLPRMKPKVFYDVAIEVAIIRPGPIAGNLTHPYLDRRAGIKPITYMHPSLEPILKRTLGVPLFQEQMLQIAMIMADFTGNEASELRRAISFNRSEERMQKVVIRLKEKMTAKGVAPNLQEEIINSVSSFALYGFPESHAISFGLLAYCSTWLKAHRPVEFYTALFNNQPMGFYSPDSLIKDAKRHGIRTKPADVNISDWHCTVESDTEIRLGLQHVNELSSTAAGRIIAERKTKPFESLEDFLLRCRLNKDERRVLAEIGALNGLVAHRRDALWKVEAQVDPDDLFFEKGSTGGPPVGLGGPAQAFKTSTQPPDSQQSDGEISAKASKIAARPPQSTGGPPVLPVMTPLERLEADYRGQNLSTGPHPMAYLRSQLPEVWLASELPSGQNGDYVKIAGLVICRQRPGTAKGNVFISLEDETGISNAFVPSKAFEKNRLVITQERFLLIEGPLQLSRGAYSVLAKKVTALTSATLKLSDSYDFR